MLEKPKIVIIGAGLAGLTAAYRLNQQNYDIEIYESRPRVGGRIHTAFIKNFDDTYSIAELGGQNLYDGGEAKNFLNLAEEFNLETIEYNWDFSCLYFKDNQKINYNNLIKEFKFNHKEIIDRIKNLKKTSNNLQDIIDDIFKDYPLLNEIFACFIASYDGLPPKLLSPLYSESFENMLLSNHFDKEVKMLSLKQGNAKLALEIAQNLRDKVYLNHILTSVTKQSDKIILSFANNKKVICDKLILAIPASVYHTINFEGEIIPKEQLNLIKKIQYGNNAKILLPISYQNLTYNNVFTSKMLSFYNSDKKLLNMYFTGDNQENITRKEIYFEQLNLLKQGYDQAKFIDIEPAKAIDEQFIKYYTPIAKSWLNDPWAQGSYSNYSIELGQKIDEIIEYKKIKFKKILAPVNDQIFFIGEHTTILPYIGTIEGAVESGERIAKVFNQS